MPEPRDDLRDALLESRGYILPLGRKKDGSMTWAMPGIVEDAVSAFTLPGDVYAGRTDPMSDEAIGRSFDLAGALTLGAGAIPAEANSLRAGIRAYHGSPHDFDEFDLSKIGTGEGAQAYGHGLYFAESPDVARSYRFAGQPSYIGSQVDGYVSDAIRATSTREEAIGLLNQKMLEAKNTGNTFEYGVLRDAVNNFDEVQKRVPGRMYEVEINADPNTFLDWDMPLSEQGRVVQDAIRPLITPERLSVEGYSDPGIIKDIWSDPSGNMIYRNMPLGGRPSTSIGAEGVSQALSREGIPGIKYLDQGSRSAGDGSRNFVVFDPKIIEIVKKYGIVAALAGGLLTEEQAVQLQEQGITD